MIETEDDVRELREAAKLGRQIEQERRFDASHEPEEREPIRRPREPRVVVIRRPGHDA